MQTEITRALDLFTLMPTTNEQVQSFASQIKNQILDGEVDFRKMLWHKKFIEKTLEAIFDDKEVKDFLIDNIEQYGKDGAGYNDIKIETSTRKTWDYSKTEDTRIAELEAKKKSIDEEIKSRQKFLQTIPQSGVADTESGELIYPAAFTTSTFIKVSTVK